MLNGDGMNSQVKLVDKFGGIQAIEKFVEEHLIQNERAIDAIRDQIALLPDMAKAALFSQFRGNLSISMSNTKKDPSRANDAVLHDLNNRVWNQFVNELKTIASKPTTHYIEHRIFCESFTQKEATVEALVALLESVQHVEDLAHFTQELKPKILEVAEVVDTDKLKFKKGSTDHKIDLISQYFYAVTEIVNIAQPAFYAKKEQIGVEGFKAIMQSYVGNVVGKDQPVVDLFVVKLFANHNINVKVTDTSYLNLFFGWTA